MYLILLLHPLRSWWQRRRYAVSREPASARSPVTGEQTIEQESLTDDVQDEEDPEGYGFGV